MNKDVAAIVKKLERQGWTFRHGKHLMAYPPDKTQTPVAISLTPSKGKRSIENMIAELRKRGADL